ncbi:MAG: hypothetical protein ABIQ65_20705, partial [Thermoanaerobaculia bacterium]
MGTITAEIVHQPSSAPTLTADAIKKNRNLVLEVVRAVMKKNVHYGTIPGTDKNSLWKPGAEVLFSTFRIAVDQEVEDISGPDERRFRVKTLASHQGTGTHLGSAIGEASTSEEKYRWRAALCAEEFEATATDRKRIKFKKGKFDTKAHAYEILKLQQIRTEP